MPLTREELDRLTDEVVKHLQALIRIDTSNPPGNELPAAEYIRDVLADEGIDATILKSAPKRANVVARLKSGSDNAGPILLMSHTDVVPANPEEWTHHPFSGEIADGFVWGRGALDMKDMTAIEMVIMLELKRRGLKLKRDVVFAATADEEMGSTYGMKWLVNNHWDMIKAEYAINEGGGVGIAMGDHMVFTCQIAEKGIAWLTLKARGNPGHGSAPTGKNAVVELSRAVARLGSSHLPRHKVDAAERFIDELARLSSYPTWLAKVLLKSNFGLKFLKKSGQVTLAALLYAIQRNTATPTMLRAGQKENVIPATAEATIDGRMLPGQTPENFIREVRRIVGDEIEIELVKSSQGYQIDHRSPLFEVFDQVLKEHYANAVLVPMMVAGVTDGRFVVPKGVKVYGFIPHIQKPELPILKLIHGVDERVSIENLRFATSVLWESVSRFVS